MRRMDVNKQVNRPFVYKNINIFSSSYWSTIQALYLTNQNFEAIHTKFEGLYGPLCFYTSFENAENDKNNYLCKIGKNFLHSHLCCEVSGPHLRLLGSQQFTLVCILVHNLHNKR